MNREKAEKLLAALVFNDLDEASKTELVDYLKTDDELRERLADMRMAMKVASDALQHGPDPVLDERRMNRLAKLAGRSRRSAIFTMRYLATAAAVVAVIALPSLFIFMPSLNKVKHLASSAPSESRSLKPGIDLAGGTSSDHYVTNTEQKYSIEFTGGTSVEYELDEKVQSQSEALGYANSDSVRELTVDEPVSLRPAEESSESEKQFAKVLRPEDTYGGGYGRGGYAGRHADGLEDDRVFDSFSVTQKTAEAASGVDQSSPDTVDRAEKSVSYDYNNRGYGWSMDGDSLTVNSVDRNASLVDGHVTNGQFNVKLGAGDIDEDGAGIFAGDEVDIDFEYQNSDITDGRKYADMEESRRKSELPASALKEKYPPKPKVPPVISKPFGTEHAGKTAEVERGGPVLGIHHRETPDRKPNVIAKGKTTASGNEVPSLGDIPATGSLFKDEAKKPLADGQQKIEESYIQHIEEKRTVQVDYTKAVVTDAIQKAQQFRDNQQFEQAKEALRKASSTIEGNKILLSNAHYDEYQARLNDLGQKVDEAKQQQEAEKKPQTEVAKMAGEIRETMETQKGQAIKNYKDRAFAFQEEQRYEEALGQLDQLLAIDPTDKEVLILKNTLENVVDYIKQREIAGETNREELETLMEMQTKSIPYSGEINYPKNWKEIAQRREELLMKDADSDVPVGEDESDLPLASRFKTVPVNPWVMSERDSLSTFALDVDTASYTLCRRYIYGGFLPPTGAVRMEEFINYFNYQYPQQANRTFMVHAEAAASPFADKGKNLTLLKVGVKARTIGRDQSKPAHLVFVVDTSASMGKPDRLPLVQQALNLLIDKLSDVDRVTLITCSNQSRLHLEATPVGQRDRIRQAINAIQPSGSTNLLAGLQLGYATARRSFDVKQINHVVLCTDGVANVGQTEADAVLKTVAADRKQGITITCVGVGFGTYNDAFLESLANKGDGSYVFLDSTRQAQRVFVEQLAATLHTVAKDARIQVSFNPDRVRRYRLIGYENRDIEDKQFRDDTIDAGEVGSGQCSTALYELELADQQSTDQQEGLGTVFVRYRHADTGRMEEISYCLKNTIVQRRKIENSPHFFLAAAVSQFAEILRQSEHVRHGSMTDVLTVIEKVSQSLPLDRDVRELTELIHKAEHLPRAQ
ncbi:MAG: von Willebrand factor type A domain-containing protein [Planctomycetota bacterium]